jgi:hypothetical protein
MVYHPNITRTVLFSGKNCQPPTPCQLSTNQTFLFDGANWANCNISCTGEEPEARTSPGIAYNPAVAADRIVLMLGGDGQAAGSGEPDKDPLVPLGDTWLLQGSTPSTVNWVRCAIARCPDNSPPARGSPTLDYDPVTGDVVAFGGHTNVPPGTYEDTWFFDYAAPVGTPFWSPCNPTGQCATHPGARFGHRTVYDSARNQIFLFAGGTATQHTNDVWFWTGNPNRTWNRCNTQAEGCPTTDVPPSARCCFGLAFDTSAAGANRVLLFGGATIPTAVLGDTWTWQPTSPYWDCVGGSCPP